MRNGLFLLHTFYTVQVFLTYLSFIFIYIYIYIPFRLKKPKEKHMTKVTEL